MDRRRYLEGLTAVVATGALAGCTGNGNGDGNGNAGGNGDGGTDAYGTLSTSVTDQPNDIGDFESLVVTIEGIWVKPAAAEGAGTPTDDAEEDDEDTPDGTATPADDGTETPADDGTETPDGDDSDGSGEDEDEDEDEGDTGRRYIEFEEPQEADLVELQDGEAQLVDETELEAREYEFLQLDVSETTGVLAESGEEATVETPGNAPLKFNQAFEIRAGETTHFLADFAPFRRGNGAYLIRPVASGTEVRYGDDTDATDSDDDTDATDSDGSAGANATAQSEAAGESPPAGGD